MTSFTIIVYQIYHQDCSLNIRYIGSTKQQLYQRWNNHKIQYQQWIQEPNINRCISIYPYFKEYNINNFKYNELARYEVTDRKEQFQYEQEWIDKLDCVNKIRAISLPPEIQRELNRNEYKFYCEDCESVFSTNGHLQRHLNGEKHWRIIFPFDLNYNMNRSEMLWEKLERKEKQKLIKQQKLNEYRKTEEFKKKDREYRSRPEVKQRMRENHRKHEKTEKGKETVKRYRQSEKGKETLRKQKEKIIEEKRYYCSICDWAFTSKQILTKHNTRKHL